MRDSDAELFDEALELLEIFGFEADWIISKRVHAASVRRYSEDHTPTDWPTRLYTDDGVFTVESSCPQCFGNSKQHLVSYRSTDLVGMLHKAIKASKRGVCSECAANNAARQKYNLVVT